ncbi:MAG TPA: AmmeMemoRadiSam system radical SAM enzyme [bacterium]|nr:AmmeMemoRadiSam system radical SAM enzyme [bacterium]
MREALLYLRLENGRVRCETCAHGCVIAPGKKGICGVRENRDGKLISLVFGKAVAAHDDPIEKKPLFHFLPGSRSFSIATAGCNMHCLNCQNADISQMPVDQGRIAGETLPPEAVVRAAQESGCDSVSFTYTEPAVFWDYAFETARLARRAGLRTVFVTNGFWSEKSLKTLLPYMDAANVDLKFFRDASYREICGARLEPVLETVRTLRRAGVWVEATTLVIPDLNDSGEELREIASFLRGTDPDMPWHVSRFHPTYRMTDRPATPVSTIRKARAIGLEEGLRFVYTGNIPGDDGESTLCPSCGETVIGRRGFTVLTRAVREGKCGFCGTEIPGVWD